MARYRAVVTLHAPVEAVTDWLRPADGVLEPVDDRTCVLRTGADSLEWLALTLGMLGVDFDVHEPPELAAYLRTLSARFARAGGITSGERA
jgi:hypothetical protein